MALASLAPAIRQQLDPIRSRDSLISGMMASRGEIVEVPVEQVVNNKIYVAVGREVKESKLTLLWALQNSGGKKIVILHIHQPAQTINIMGGKFPVDRLKEAEVRAHRELERQTMHKVLNEYQAICAKVGVVAEKLHTVVDSIEKGIVDLVSDHKIRRLVMGAAADKQYSRKMMDLKSKKAIYVRLQAAASCRIWFTCKGHLIHTREASPTSETGLMDPMPLQASPISETTLSNPLRSRSIALGLTNQSHTGHDPLRRVRSVNVELSGHRVIGSPSTDGTGGLYTPVGSLHAEGISRCTSQSSQLSTCSSSDVINDSLFLYVNTVGSGDIGKVDLHNSSPPSVLEGNMNDELYDQLEQAMSEAHNSRQEAFEESVRRRKAEKDAIDANRRARESENLYARESMYREQIEAMLKEEAEELEKMKNQQDEVTETLRVALEQKLELERQIDDSEKMVKELEGKIFSAVELLQNYKNERDELQKERDSALKEAEELRKKRTEEASSTSRPQFCSEFSFSEIDEATNSFDSTLKIGEGGYGIIYRGILRYTQVAIKVLHSHSLQGPSEFQQEVDVLSKLRHPNLITLIGACPEACALIYEYLPNGNLEDRLNCRDNTPPLSWQTRIRVATELCAALAFLHSNSPQGIVHGDLKPSNILLDGNYISKLSDFGICRLISNNQLSSNSTTFYLLTHPKGTFAYMDPEFMSTGELTLKSDVYSFGIVLLQLLTGKQASRGLGKEVQSALDSGKLNDLLDPSAGDWPFVQASQLAHLALRCCEEKRRNRPDIESEVWRVLEPMRASCGGSSSFRLGLEERCRIPSYFICPIFQEVMQDPHVAADGFTYEAEALRGWLDSGHDTSPMTNLKLEHINLVPNHALRSAIQEWLQQPN